MKTLLFLSLISATPTFAALNIKPGLWTIETRMKRYGKEYDPQAKMKEAMARMTPEQKKNMQEMMKRMGHGRSAFGMGPHGLQICFTGDMLKNEEVINHRRDPDCEISFPVKTSTHVVTNFKCKSGSNGSVDWTVKDSTHYDGTVKMADKEGKKSEIVYHGSFASKDCGDVKPFSDIVNKKSAKN